MIASDDGQAAVELALVTPLLFVLLLAVVQVGLVIRDQVLVVNAAREGARAAAVDSDDGAAIRAARAVPGIDPARMRVAVSRGSGAGATVRVDVEYEARTDVPLLRGFMRTIRLHANAVMRIEARSPQESRHDSTNAASRKSFAPEIESLRGSP